MTRSTACLLDFPNTETTLERATDTPLLGAIDVGTNAIRLEIARPLPDGSLETLHQERDPVRPGEGVFKTGVVPREVADRLLSTLRRYAALCRRDGAFVRAVATSALREARNGPDLVRRVRAEAGLELEVISGREEARLICLGVLQGMPPRARSLVLDIGGGSTEVATAVGDEPSTLLSVALGAVRLTEMFELDGKVGDRRLALVRSYADEAFREGLPRRLAHPRHVFGSSGTINAVVGFAASKGARRATHREVERAVEALARMSLAERRRHLDPKRAEIIVGGAAVLAAAMRALRLESIHAVDTGLRNGILIDLHVGALAVTLFEDLAELHDLPPASRRLLEVAAILHDVGNAVSFHRHHKHTLYLVANADLPGLSNRERELAALVARFHRRSLPARGRADLASLSPSELVTVRKLAAILRLANALDASHQQHVRSVRAAERGGGVTLRLRTRGAVDLELWDAAREAAFFREVFRRRLELVTSR